MAQAILPPSDSHPPVILSAWAWSRTTDFLLRNRIQQREGDVPSDIRLQKTVTSILLAFCWVVLTYLHWWSKLPGGKLPHAEPDVPGAEGGLQSATSKELVPLFHSCSRNCLGNSHVSEPRRRDFPSGALRWLQPQTTPWLSRDLEPDNAAKLKPTPVTIGQ